MKAMYSTAVGGPESLVLTELETPQPGKGEVLVRTRAAGVNFPDVLMLKDMYQFKPPRPFAPGGEIAGEVEAVGEGVTAVAPGDRVLGLTGHGGFATHTMAGAGRIIKIPDDMPFEDAACFIFTYGTSYHALKDRAHLKPGDTLLILGAAGGVGSAAIELGKAMGARVIAAVSSPDKAAFCTECGADATIVYDRDLDKDGQKAFSQQIKEVAGPHGCDVVYDAVGGAYAEPAVRALAWQGRFLVVGFPAGIPKLPLNLALLKGCQIVGVFWGDATRRDPEGHARNVAELFEMYGKGQIKPRISATFPLAEVAGALTMMQDRKVLGKVVVTTD